MKIYKRKMFFCNLVLVSMLVVACSGNSETKTEKKIEAAVIIKATSSDFWQYLLVGAENYGVVHPSVNVTTYGPSTEQEISEQVTILENIINASPDVIVIASTSSDATVDAINSARKAGIVVITADNKVNTETDAFLATDNINGGSLAADFMLKRLMKEQGVSSLLELSGSIIVVTGQSGTQVLESRNEGFISFIETNAPHLDFITTIDINNDMSAGISAFESVVSANSDLVGVFANNNTSGNAVAKVLEERNLSNIVAVAYDSDEAEVNAIKNNWLDALVVQDPYRMGYDGLEYGLQKLAGLSIPSVVDTGITLVTNENVNNPSIQAYLDPRQKSLVR